MRRGVSFGFGEGVVGGAGLGLGGATGIGGGGFGPEVALCIVLAAPVGVVKGVVGVVDELEAAGHLGSVRMVGGEAVGVAF